jgi:hypothetical protein
MGQIYSTSQEFATAECCGCPWTEEVLPQIISELQVFYFNLTQRAVPAA